MRLRTVSAVILTLSIALIPLVNADGGAVVDQPGEFWVYSEGPEINETKMSEYPALYEGEVNSRDSCVWNGTEYLEGHMLDVGQPFVIDGKNVTFEAGGWNRDKEICLNIPSSGDDVSGDNYFGGDQGGEWYDQDQQKVNEYIRNNKEGIIDNAWTLYWRENPDTYADPETGVIKGEGIALEDDCKVAGTGGTSPCEDIRSDTGFEPPFSAPFTEGQRDDDHDDFRNVFPLEGLNNYHNRVQSGGHTGHPEPLNGQPQDGKGNSQYNETDLELGPLENSRIDAEDDEWALTPDLSYSIANNGTPFAPGRCYGAYRVQGTDKNKRQAVYANSFAGTGQVYNGGNSSTSYFQQNPFFSGDPEAAALDGNWRDPDKLSSFERFAGTSFFSCDLTGNDWGFAYSGRDTEFDCVYPTSSRGVALNQKKCRGEGNPSSPGDEGVFRPDEVNEETGVPDLHAVQASREQLQFDVNSDPYRNLADGWGVIKYTGDSGPDRYFIDFVGSRGNIIFAQSRPDQSQAIRVGGIGDLDQDGKREQIFKHRNGSIMSLSLDPDRDTAQDRYRDLGVLSAEHEDFSEIGDTGSELSPGGVADFDGDGDPEAAFISESTELAFVEADGDVQSTDIGAIDAGMAGDWDQDGDPEVVYIASDGSDGNGGTLGVAEGDGTFTETPIDDAVDAGGIGDVDGDRRPEAVYLDEEWYIGHIDSEIEFSEGFGDGAGQDGLAPQARDIGGVGDADGDGILEVSFVKGEKEGTSESTNLDIWTVDRNGEARKGLASDYRDFQGSTGALMMGGYVPPRSDRNRNLAQYPNACGDDPNEYLIREHAATLGGEDNPSFSGRENMYACADRPSDCVFQGEVYSAGQVVDVQENSAGENGVNSYDQEICADIDPELPGGEWVDVDNEKIRDMLVGDGTGSEPEYLVQNGRPEPDDPGDIVWHDGTRDGEHNKAAHEAMISPFNPVDYQTGYALEDDCDPAMAEDRLGACDDSGSKEKLIQGELIYSPFKTMKSDDHNVFSTEAISMYVGDGTGEDGSDQHGQNNGQDTEAVSPNTDFTVTEDGKNVELNDSEINRLEDTWAVSSYIGHVVGPTGRVYENGSCYGTPALSQGDLKVNKGEKVVANSFAKAFDVDEDGQDEGVWVDPDTTEKSVTQGGTSCDLVGEDWGIGYNTGSGLEVRNANDKTAYEPTDLHVVTGDITFDINSDPNGFGEDRNLEQHPNVCGDDRNEYLIREHGDAVEKTEQSPNLDQNNIYVCADRISDCAFNGEVYSEGQLVDIQSNQREEKGADSVDEEVCVDVDKSVPGGEWVDVDDESINQLLKGSEGSYNEDNPDTYEGLVRSNVSYDGPGIKWFTDEYAPAAEVEKSPFNPLDYSDGYALEDDVGPDVRFTSDEGPDEEKFTPDAVYSFFEELHRTDDRKASLMKGATDEEIREGDLFTGISVRMYVGTADGDASYKHGATNGQDQENVPDSLDFTVTKNGKTVPLNDSTIDPLEDTWAISTYTDAVVGPTGKVYENGSCYGRKVLDQPDLQLTKAQKAVGNSYAMSLDVNGDGTSLKKGVWVNPDSTPKSVTSGGLGCELNATDWGIGYDTGPGSDLNVIRGAGSESGDVRERDYDRDDPHAVTGDIQFDYESDPGILDQDNLKQYPDACGDDRNEYLIREHNASERFNDEDNPSLVRDNIYVCADRISDCAFNGSVYSEGEVVDIQAGDPPGQDEEAGVNSVDEEICVDVDETVPGGEWMDVDNSSINQVIKGKEGTYTEDDPSTYKGHVRSNLTYNGEGVKWFTDEYAPAAEVEKSPFNPLNYSDGYALEDDCGPGVNCSDEGEDIIDFTPEADYSFFEAGNITDDRIDSVYSTGNWDRTIEGEVFNGISVRMWVGYANGTAYYEHGSSNGQDQQNAPEDLNFNVTKFGKTVPLNDSTIDPLEDTWAIANRTDAVVGPTGKVYMNGSCYGQNVLDYENLTVTKAERAVGNSYAMSLDVDGDSTSNRQGVWVNPDSTPKSAVSGGLSCELNSTDWGFGYNIGEGTELREVRGSGSAPGDIRQPGYDRDDPHVVAGNIQFDNVSDPTGYNQDNLRQYPDACGDDRNEYLIREHRGTGEGIEHDPSLVRNNIYVCADRISDCAFNGSVYSEGEVVDIQANDPPGADEEAGADSIDEEICVDVDKTVPGGEWLDVDNESLNSFLKGNEGSYLEDSPDSYSGHVRSNRTYDGPGIKWFTDKYAPAAEVELSPYNPLNYSDGYALEDDVGPGVEFTSDEGPEEERFTPDAVYSFFEDSHITDDRKASVLTEQGENPLDGELFEGISVQMKVGFADGRSFYRHGSSNNQDQENVPSSVDFTDTKFGKTVPLNDSTIDPLEDTWAIANRTDAVVGPTGKVYMNGSCYGKSALTADNFSVNKGERVVANSYAMSLDINGDGTERNKGVWVNPDSTPKSALSGVYGCELNATDWGYGYNTGDGSELTAVAGEVRQEGYSEGEAHVVVGDIQFDNESDPEGVQQDNLRQYPDACGDDRNEYLIREHRDSSDRTEQSFTPKDDMYVCADRISDCALDGEVYSEGQLADVQSSDREERGPNSVDEEVCVDVDKSVPGGEWLDVDNESINQLLKGEEGTYTPDDVSSYNANVRWNGTYDGEGVKWFTHDYSAAREIEISPYNPLNYSDGYALEDDVGPGVDQSSDEGARLQRFTPDAVYSFFEPGHIEDDRVSSLVGTGDQESIRGGDVFSGISVKMRVGYANGTAYTAHGRSNSQDKQNVPAGLDFTDTKFGKTVPLNDSTIDPLEDTWAIANRTDAVVGPTGRPYMNGSCYGPNALNDPDLFVSKAEKVVGNSYAMSLDVDGDGTDTRRGVWVNPDSTVDSALVGGMRCDLNATDWGYGFDQGEKLQVKKGDVRTQGYSEPEGHVVAGEIQFDSESDPVGQPQDNLKQYPDACGDDRNEYLIREHTAPGVQSEHDPSLERDNIYVCADRISDCAFNGSVYSMGQTADVSGTDEELGVNSDDAEICVDMNEDIPGGEWADPDNATIQRKIVGSGEFEKPSTYAGDPTYERRGGGVRWFNTSYSPETQYPINESYTSPWSEVNYSAGYAFEDDCGPDVEFCEDSGLEETKKEGKAVFGPFQEGELADDGNAGIDGYHIRTWVDGSAKHGAQNSQQFENVYVGLPDLNDSTIDPDEDTWAIASEPYYAVGPTGAVYKNGSCYGPDNPEFKSGTVMANSFVLAHDVDGDGTKEGDWVDPDQHERAILLGQGSCTVGEVTDWGLGYNNRSKDDLKIIEGREETRTLGYEEGPSWQKPVVSGPITFDNESVSGENPGEMSQDDLPQYGNACGDDQYEILIREHSSLTKDLENNRPDEHIPTLERDNIFVCADRVSDCAYNGSVYSEGQVVDVGRDNEAGSNSSDLEVCIDTDKRIPGGEWMDIDNSTWNQHLKGEEGTYTPDQPSTYEHLVSTDSSLRNYWLTDENPHAREVELSPYNPLNYSDGYALEDDCSEGVQYCADIGRGRQHNPTGTVYSFFKEDRGEDDADILEGKAVRMWVGYANGTAYTSHGSTNNQTEENAGDLNYTHYKWGVETPLNDSTIDPTEDTWAIANRSQGVVGPTGEIYQAGKCYGSIPDYTQEESIRKNDTVVANSFAYTMEANDDGNSEGVWVNPDSTNQTLLSGGLSCELNTSDWGIGYDNGPDSDLQAIRTSESNIRTPGYEPSDIHSVSGPIAFDSESDPGPKEQRDKPQFPSACGDDQGEFLIREHGTPDGNEYEASLSSRDNIYVCADRISDCAYNGKVYSEGQTVDVSKASVPSEDPERGQNINDPEICLDLDKEIPGGEWYDMDNNFTVKSRIDELGYKPEDTWENVVYFQNRFYGESKATDWKNQSERLGRYETSFFNASGVQNPEYEYYDPEGYATEDDCGPLLQEAGLGPCGDVGRGTQNTSWFNAGNFSFIPSNPKMQEGAYQDNFDTDLGIRGRHNRIDDSSDQLEPGAATQANFNLTDVFGFGYNISDTRDSTPGPDRWALTRFLNSSIDNRGNVYRPGTVYRSGCFYREGVDRRDSIDDETVLKTEKVYGNSFADASDYDDDGTTEGVWEDPDDMASMYMNFSCDLTGPDKGLGYDNNSENGVFRYKFNEEDTKTIIGDIAFSVIEGKKGSFAQEPPVCGDDHKEYLIEELGAVSNSLEGEGRFGCGTDANDCVARSGGEYALYRNGDYVNTDEAVEDFGRIKQDQEVCQQTVGDRYGVWYDQDYSREFCRTNNLYGRAGVRWISQDYIDRHPYSVEGGINDDLNPYLYNKMSEFNVSTQGNISRYVGLADRSGYTPVGTGKDVNSSVRSEYRGFVPPENYLNLTATAGFCGGDDLGEAVVVQESATQLIPSNYSVIGIADSVDDCPLDGSNIDAVDHNRRQIYNEGENVTLDLGPTERTISCQSGKWYADWPVVFLRDSLSVEQESTVDIPFKVVNVRDSQTTYNVTLDPQSSIDAFTGFTRFDQDRFQTTVSAQSTRRFNVEFYGQDTDLGPEDIKVKVESLDGEINGTDTVAVNVKQDVNKEQVSGTEEVPGIGSFQLLVLMLAAYTVYTRLVVRKDI